MAISLLSLPLRYFLEVARTGSVNQAAQRLHVAASAVSRQLGKLEDSLGVVLFERQARGMTLTEAGTRLLAHASAHDTQALELVEQLQDLSAQGALRVRLACTEGFSAAFTPLVMAGFRQAHPQVQLQLQVAVPQEVSALVLRGEAVYTHGRSFALADVTTYPSTVERSTLDYIVSLEWALPHDTRLNIQGFQRIYDGGADGIAFANDGVGASVFVSTKLKPTLEPQLLWIRNFHDGGQMVRPRLNWTVAPNLTLAFGVDIFSGPRDTFFGRYTDRDRVYTEARWDF